MITNVGDLEVLKDLGSLRDLSLGGQDNTPNPICRHPAYPTVVHHALPLLKRLDLLDVDADVLRRRLRETLQKTRMYSRVREWAAAEMEDELCDIAVTTAATPLKGREMVLRSLLRAKELGIAPGLDIDDDTEARRLKAWRAGCAIVKRTYSASVVTCRWLISLERLSLATLGSVRYIRGSADDPWYKGCEEFVLKSRLLRLGPNSSFRVASIVRIRNEALQRLHAEARRRHLQAPPPMPSPSTSSSGWVAREGDTLRYAPDDPKFAAAVSTTANQLAFLEMEACADDDYELREIGAVADRGFGAATQIPLNAPSRLTTSFDMVLGGGSPRRRPRIVLVASVCVARCSNVAPGTEISRTSKVPNPVLWIAGGDAAATGVKHGTYHLMDPGLAVPEFVVQVEWDEDTRVPPSPPAKPIGDLEQVAVGKYMNRLQTLVKEGGGTPMYQTLAGSNDLASITVLNLHGAQLESIPGLSELTCVKECVVSFNRLSSLDDFANLPALETLDASFNAIQFCHSFTQAPQLRELDLRSNSMRHAQTLRPVICGIRTLVSLDLRFNPFHVQDLALTINELRGLSGHLEITLDECPPLSTAGTARFGWSIEPSTPLLVCSSAWIADILVPMGPKPPLLKHPVAPEQPPDGDTALVGETVEEDTATAAATATPRLDAMTAIVSVGSNTAVLSGLQGYSSLRWLVIRNAGIEELAGTSACPKLEELCLAGNLINAVGFLSHLPLLTRLDLSRNAVRDLRGIERCQQLQDVNVDHNRLSSLAPLATLSELEQCHAAHNLLAAGRVLMCLRQLDRLKVLAVKGNPMCTQPESSTSIRTFVLYYLRKIRILDADAVTTADADAAAKGLDGVLTPDVVLDNLGDGVLETVTSLDIAGASLKVIRQLPVMPALTSVNLKGNVLTSFGVLNGLPELRVLCLDGNKIRHLGGKLPKEGGVFVKLEVLDLARNGLSDLAPLELRRFPNLNTLFLQHNVLVDTAGLAYLPALENAVLDHNRLKTITPDTLSTCPWLVELHLSANRLPSLQTIPIVARLKRLYIRSNKISVLVGLEELAKLTRLTDIVLDLNPCTRHQNYRRDLIMSLSSIETIDSVAVTDEELDMILAAEYHGHPAQVGSEAVVAFTPASQTLTKPGNASTNGHIFF